LDALLKRAEKIAETRNLVAHNPLLLSLDDTAAPITNLKKPSASVASADLPAVITEAGAVAGALYALHLRAFQKEPAYNAANSPVFVNGERDARDRGD